MKWLLIVVIYMACSDPATVSTWKTFDTEAACEEYAEVYKRQLAPGSTTQCTPLIEAQE